MCQVALEVLSYHNAASVDEVEELINEGVPAIQDHEDISSWVEFLNSSSFGRKDALEIHFVNISVYRRK